MPVILANLFFVELLSMDAVVSVKTTSRVTETLAVFKYKLWTSPLVQSPADLRAV